MNPYDQVLYPSHPHPESHPDRLATVGALFGLDPPALSHARVLEIGCGNGGNLVPMAWGLPDSELLGIDLAASPIAAGNEMIAALGLKNVRLQHGDILDLQPGWAQFDYIIAHGFYSWVPAPARDQLFKLCRHCLAPHGVAFISYNAYPGSHLRQMIRQMMLFHIQGFDSPEQRLQQATALLSFLAAAQEGDAVPDEYRHWLKAELRQIRGHEPGHLYHDDLAHVNDPVYFTQFMAHAQQHGLQYLGEADWFEMSDHHFAPAVRRQLQSLARNRILREQYLDFLKCRRFRQTLLCQKEAALAPEPQAQAVTRFYISTTLRPATQPVDLSPNIPVSFATPKGAKVQTDFPPGKACLDLLSRQGPTGLAFEALLLQVRQSLHQSGLNTPIESVREHLPPFLLQLYSAGQVAFRSHPVPCPVALAPRPVASPIVRWQIQRSNLVTSLFHVAIQVEDEIGRQLLLALDGSRDRGQLAEIVWQVLESRGALPASPQAKAQTRQNLPDEVDKNLEKLARLGLLVA